MMKPTLVLIVDADIARSAGPDHNDRNWSPSAKHSFDLLHEIKENTRFKVAFDKCLQKEWLEHQGKTARRWFADMLSTRRIHQIAEINSQWLDTLIKTLPDDDRATATKDRHLIILAVDHASKRILSNDRKARKKFENIADPRVATVHWVSASDEATKWLRAEAPEKKELMLSKK